MRHAFFPFMIVVFYLVDVAFFHASGSLGLHDKGFVSLFWLMWFIYVLFHQKMSEQLLMAGTISVVIWLSGIHGFGETLIPLLTLIAGAWLYHLWFISNRPFQHFVFVAFSLGLYLLIRQIKMASQLSLPMTYLVESGWLKVYLINLVLYILCVRRVYDFICQFRERRLFNYDG